MKIVRKSCAQGAREAEGTTVVIDVFRAFTCIPLFFHFGARKVILEADPKTARSIKKAHTDFILVGEINAVPMEDAQLGNSPTEIILKGERYFKNQTIIHRTTADVTGAKAAFERVHQVILASFVTAQAIADYVRKMNPPLVTLVAMGDRTEVKAPEDEACADYLECLIEGKPYDRVNAFKNVVFQKTAQKFLQGTKAYLPKEDPIFCLQPNLFNMVPKVKRDGDFLTVDTVVA